MKKKLTMIGLAVAAVVVAWAAIDHRSGNAQTAPPGPPQVTVSRVLERPVADSADFIGKVQAIDTVKVQPRVSGYVQAVKFKEGALVHKGETLFKIDPRPFQAEVDRLTAQRAQAKSQLDLAWANARRAKLLLTKHAIAQQDADRQITAAQSARAALAAADAALAAARLNLDFTDVRAPIDGRVSNARVTPGNLVTSADVLTTLVSVNPVYVYFDADEHTWLKLDHLREKARADGGNARTAVTMGLADEKGYPHAGHLDFVDNQLHSDSGTMRLRAVFDNAHGLLTPGLYAHVRLQAGRPKPRILIDDRAVGTDLGNQFAYVIDKDHKVQYRKIVTGGLFHGLRIVDAGLKPGDEIVVNGLQRVRPGAQVNPQLVAMGNRLDARDRALVDAAGKTPSDDKRTAQADQNAVKTPIASVAPRERRTQAERVALPAGG
ncbi:MAG TPA: efflux RND transporter periplasmic adaptor subunit [Rhodanobacteraceae bacterium]|nr:efflux RND transporter periplasmic adaptor subunit [Rhodanobacteraceae bacterium]